MSRTKPFLPRRRMIGLALFASLAINAFFIGAAATDVFSARGADAPQAPGGSLFRLDLRWLDGRLPDDAMAKVTNDVARGVSGADRRFERLHELRTGLGVLVAAPTPDKAMIEAKLAEIRAELDRLLSETQAATVASVLALPAETRASLGEVPDPQS
jgi:hypothetical protein